MEFFLVLRLLDKITVRIGENVTLFTIFAVNFYHGVFMFIIWLLDQPLIH